MSDPIQIPSFQPAPPIQSSQKSSSTNMLLMLFILGAVGAAVYYFTAENSNDKKETAADIRIHKGKGGFKTKQNANTRIPQIRLRGKTAV